MRNLKVFHVQNKSFLEFHFFNCAHFHTNLKRNIITLISLTFFIKYSTNQKFLFLLDQAALHRPIPQTREIIERETEEERKGVKKSIYHTFIFD